MQPRSSKLWLYVKQWCVSCAWFNAVDQPSDAFAGLLALFGLAGLRRRVEPILANGDDHGVRLVVSTLVATSLLIGPSLVLAAEPTPPASAAPPRTGTGRIVVGSILLGTGVAGIATGGWMIGHFGGEFSAIGAAPIMVGVTMIAVGIPVLITGAQRRSAFLQWQREPGQTRAQLLPTPWATPTSVGLGLVGRF